MSMIDRQRLVRTKELLYAEQLATEGCVGVHPVVHNDDCIYLQMTGWCITLLNDGTWFIEGTDGG